MAEQQDRSIQWLDDRDDIPDLALKVYSPLPPRPPLRRSFPHVARRAGINLSWSR